MGCGERHLATRTREDRRLRLLSAVCLGLPEAERINCGAHADFRVRGKVFAYFLKNHGGDGVIAACFKSRLGEHVEHVKRAPDRFYLPRYIGRRGWCGLRLDQGDIDWDEVKELALVSYNLAAPKGLRTAPPPVANVLTAQSLVRGSPPAINGNLLAGVHVAEERSDPAQLLRPTAVPGAAEIGRTAGLRSRR
jgi:predicted DNA-binding protein (MmcQ/YjbR family)